MTAEIDVDLADYAWLIGQEAAAVLAALGADTRTELQIADKLRRDWSASRVRLLLEQLDLRRRARVKFPHAERMFFTRVGLEQATDAATAAAKASRFPRQGEVVDLCCGVGGDLLALAVFTLASGYDRNPVVALLARANANALGLTCRVHAAAADPTALGQAAAWHIDPDRRPQGRRTTQVELHDPSAAEIDALLAAAPHAAIKLAPAARAPDAWEHEGELEWLSRDGECKQLVVWLGDLAGAPGRRRASIVGSDGALRATIVGEPGAAPLTEELGAFLYEPDPAVLASDLVGSLAIEQQLAAIAPRVGYLTGAEGASTPLLAAFRIRDVMPFDRRRLIAYLRERHIGRLEIKHRAADISPDRLRRELRVPGDEQATLIIAPHRGKLTAFVTERPSIASAEGG